jgi:hypothetical protein
MADTSDALAGIELRVRDGEGMRTVATLDQALAYLQAQDGARYANREGVLFRLQSARTPDEKRDAANAFRGWLDATGLRVAARPAR